MNTVEKRWKVTLRTVVTKRRPKPDMVYVIVSDEYDGYNGSIKSIVSIHKDRTIAEYWIASMYVPWRCRELSSYAPTYEIEEHVLS